MSSKDLSAAEAKCQRLLAVRERAAGELRQRLLADGFSKDIADTLLERLLRSGLVDDQRFARFYIQMKQRLGWGQQRITRELRKLTIDLQEYPELLDELNEHQGELERAQAALSRHHSRAKDIRASRYRYLASKGFAPDLIVQALRSRADE